MRAFLFSIIRYTKAMIPDGKPSHFYWEYSYMYRYYGGLILLKKIPEIIPAIIADNQVELDKRLDTVKDHVETVQLDFMDNKFVPNTSLWFDYLLSDSSIKYEAHLMIENPFSWILSHLDHIDIFLVHFESTDKIDRIIDYVRDTDRSIGIVLNPETPITDLVPFIEEIDQVLIMTVHPGFYGSSFLPEMLDKVRWLRSRYPDIDIEVDGGITLDTISSAAQAGANKFVSGSFIVKSSDPKGAIVQLKKEVGSIIS